MADRESPDSSLPYPGSDSDPGSDGFYPPPYGHGPLPNPDAVATTTPVQRRQRRCADEHDIRPLIEKRMQLAERHFNKARTSSGSAASTFPASEIRSWGKRRATPNAKTGEYPVDIYHEFRGSVYASAVTLAQACIAACSSSSSS